MTVTFSYRAVWPELPGPQAWLPYLQPALKANWHTNFGPVCRQFETALQRRYGGPSTVCVSASSATAGLAACLIAHQITGSVICPAFTFPATASAILMAGAQPVITDVAPESMTIAPDTLDRVLVETGARAAIVLAPYGIAVDLSDQADVCARRGARLIIDNASGLGIDRATPESASHVDEVYSLHATKPFNIGEGGMIFSNRNHEQALRSALNFGLTSHTATGADRNPHWGINGKLSEVQAAVGLAVLDEIDARIAGRQEMVARWVEALTSYGVVIPFDDPAKGIWQLFPILAPNERTAVSLVQAAQENGVELRRYYRPCLGACTGMLQAGPCPVSADLANRVVTLPVRSRLTQSGQFDMIDRCLRALEAAQSLESARYD